MTDTYFKILVWKNKHDELAREVFSELFGENFMARKESRKSRFRHHHMIGTSMMTEKTERDIKEMSCGKIKVLDKEPRFWSDR